jgi:hypothetical protein
MNTIQPYNFHLKGSADENLYAIVLGEPNQGNKAVFVLKCFQNLSPVNMNNVQLTIKNVEVFFTLLPNATQLGNAGQENADSWLERVGIELFQGEGNTYTKRKKFWMDNFVDYLNNTNLSLDYELNQK